MPLAPRLARTVSPSRGREYHSTSRTGMEEETNSREPSGRAAARVRARPGSVSSWWVAKTRRWPLGRRPRHRPSRRPADARRWAETVSAAAAAKPATSARTTRPAPVFGVRPATERVDQDLVDSGPWPRSQSKRSGTPRVGRAAAPRRVARRRPRGSATACRPPPPSRDQAPGPPKADRPGRASRGPRPGLGEPTHGATGHPPGPAPGPDRPRARPAPAPPPAPAPATIRPRRPARAHGRQFRHQVCRAAHRPRLTRCHGAPPAGPREGAGLAQERLPEGQVEVDRARARRGAAWSRPPSGPPGTARSMTAAPSATPGDADQRSGPGKETLLLDGLGRPHPMEFERDGRR